MDPNDFHRMLRGFFGFNPFPGSNDSSSVYRNRNDQNDGETDDPNNTGQSTRDGPNFFNFNVLTDPLEMHRFFEQQMEQMLKDFSGLPGRMQPRGYIEDEGGTHDRSESYTSDRDMMLKHDDYQHEKRLDSDVDENNISADELSKFFKKDNKRDDSINSDRDMISSSGRGGDPLDRDAPGWFSNDGTGWNKGPGGFRSFSYSRSSVTIQKPDGSIETKETTRNPDGSETVRIWTNRNGEQQEKILQQEPSQSPALQPPTDFNQIPPGFQDLGRLFGGFGGQFGGQRQDFDERPVVAPPQDRLYDSLFSKFFGK